MPIRILLHFGGRNTPKIRQPWPSKREPSIVTEKSIRDFTRVVEQSGILNPAQEDSGPRAQS
jgi:hypothetical protein